MSDRKFSDWMPPTLVEWLVIIAIIGTLIGLLSPTLMAIRDVASRDGEQATPRATLRLETVEHDKHLWVISDGLMKYPATFSHHPDCPCSGKAER